MASLTTDQRLDLRGRSITTTILYEAWRALTDAPAGATIELLVDNDPAIEADIAAWCRTAGHRLIDWGIDGSTSHVTVGKGAARFVDRRLAVVISHYEFDKLEAPLEMALAGALEGLQVALYLRGPAVQLLDPEFVPGLRGLWHPLTWPARRRQRRVGRTSPLEKLGQLVELGAEIYACGPSLTEYGVPCEGRRFQADVAQWFAFMEVMEASDIHVYS